MKLVKSALVIFTRLNRVAFVVTNALLHTIRYTALPDYAEEAFLRKLSGEVTLPRISFAIPHFYAQNETGSYMATGFAIAPDCLWQMVLLRKVTQGRLSEIFG